MLQLGERSTQIVLWEVDDPAKRGDGAFWWPDGPKGHPLAAWRERSGGEEIELPVDLGERTVRLSTAEWGDPERTYVLVVTHSRRPEAAGTARKPGGGRAGLLPKQGDELEPGVYLLDARP
jgi:hypothetical protein